MGNTFPKEERLYGKSLIDSLFQNGSSFVVYPYRVVFLFSPAPSDAPPARVLVSVTKRRFRRAVDRNLLKRRMREAYRFQKNDLHEFFHTRSGHLLIAFQYVGKEKLLFAYLRDRMRIALSKIMDESSRLLLGNSG